MKLREAIQIAAIIAMALLTYAIMQEDDARAAQREQDAWQGSKVDK